MDKPASRKLYKVVVVGEKGSGKTSIVKRYTSGVFHPRYKETIGVDFGIKKMIDEKGEEIHIQFWDLGGLERNGQMTKTYYEGANGFIFVCDASNLASRSDLTIWLEDVANKHEEKPTSCVFVVNKTDLATKIISESFPSLLT